MTVWMCATCGLEHPDTQAPPIGNCAICADDRQYLPVGGQAWKTLADIQRDRSVQIVEIEPDLRGIVVTPSVGIGHRALLVRTPHGNVLFDPPGIITDDLVAQLRKLGGVTAIATSHPHLTGMSVTFSHTFGHCPLWYGADDRTWVRRPDPVIHYWQDRQEILPGLALIQCGGHFAGSAVLHWAAGAGGQGAILCGDTVRPNADRTTVSFMRSYPNLIPLPARSIRKIASALAPLAFDRIYGGFGETIATDGHQSVQHSATRYIAWLTDQIPDPTERQDSDLR